MSVFQDVSNWLLGSYKVRTSQLSNQALIQHMRLDIGSGTTESQLSASNPLPVSGSLTSSSYALRMDEGATYTYIGEASTGTATSAAEWRVKRLTNADNTIVWADGNANFDNVWDNRASLAYS